MAFHTCCNLICALIWLTESTLNFCRRDAVEILSLIFEPFRHLSSLFCISCISFRSAHRGSEIDMRTRPSSWSPYRILEVKIPSTIFWIDFENKWLFSRLIMYFYKLKHKVYISNYVASWSVSIYNGLWNVVLLTAFWPPFHTPISHFIHEDVKKCFYK